jgi:hypothetical protein
MLVCLCCDAVCCDAVCPCAGLRAPCKYCHRPTSSWAPLLAALPGAPAAADLDHSRRLLLLNTSRPAAAAAISRAIGLCCHCVACRLKGVQGGDISGYLRRLATIAARHGRQPQQPASPGPCKLPTANCRARLPFTSSAWACPGAHPGAQVPRFSLRWAGTRCRSSGWLGRCATGTSWLSSARAASFVATVAAGLGCGQHVGGRAARCPAVCVPRPRLDGAHAAAQA